MTTLVRSPSPALFRSVAFASLALCFGLTIPSGAQSAAERGEGVAGVQVAQAPRFVGRSNRVLLGAPVSLDSCLDDQRRVIGQRDTAVLGIVPVVHTGHRHSFRYALWNEINAGIFDSPNAASKNILRVQMSFRVLTDKGDFPLVFDDNRHHYFLACALNQSTDETPNDYPTVVLTIEGPDGAAQRGELAQFLSSRDRLPFVDGAPGSPQNAVPPPRDRADGEVVRARDLVSAVFSTGEVAFLAGWPGKVTLALDDPSLIGPLAELRLIHDGQGEKAPAPAIAPDQTEQGVATAPPPPPAPTATLPVPASPTERTGPFVVLVPELLAGQDLSARMREIGGRCGGQWRRLPDDPRAYEIVCDLPPPYTLSIGAMAPLRAPVANRIIRADELVVDTSIPLGPGWPEVGFPEREAVIGPIPLKDFLRDGARVPMLAGDDAVCVARVPGDLSIALDGVTTPLVAPCVADPLALPSGWAQRIKGNAFPIVEGCLAGSEPAQCLRPRDAALPLRLDFGPGWAPVEATAIEVADGTLASRVRPVWPYAPDPVTTTGANGTTDWLELLNVAYCYDARGEHCCGEGPRPVNRRLGEEPSPALPSLAEVQCRPDQPLPHFGVAEFQRVSAGTSIHRFRRFWTISATAGRPYQIPRIETIRTYPLRLDTSQLPAEREGWQIVFFPTLLSCQTAKTSDGLDAFPYRGEDELAGRTVSVPVFVRMDGLRGPVSMCAEGILDPREAGAVSFSLLPRAVPAVVRDALPAKASESEPPSEP
jgi:hypothetical protein